MFMQIRTLYILIKVCVSTFSGNVPRSQQNRQTANLDCFSAYFGHVAVQMLVESSLYWSGDSQER